MDLVLQRLQSVVLAQGVFTTGRMRTGSNHIIRFVLSSCTFVLFTGVGQAQIKGYTPPPGYPIPPAPRSAAPFGNPPGRSITPYAPIVPNRNVGSSTPSGYYRDPSSADVGIESSENNIIPGRMQERLYGPASQTNKSPADVQVEFGNAQNKLKQALRSKDYDSLGSSSNDIRDKASGLRKDLAPSLPLEERLKLPLLERDYRQGADMIEQGRSKKNDIKINQGLQQIDRANNQLRQLNPPTRNKGGNKKNR